MNKRFYKVVGTNSALRNLHDEADKAGKQAVGVSPSGAIYTWNKEKNAPEKISIEQAAEILETGTDQIEAFLKAKGNYVIQDPVDAHPEELPKETAQEEQTVVNDTPVDQDRGEDVLKLLELIEEATKRSTEEIVKELRKVDVALAEKIEKLQESVSDLATIVRDHILL